MKYLRSCKRQQSIFRGIHSFYHGKIGKYENFWFFRCSVQWIDVHDYASCFRASDRRSRSHGVDNRNENYQGSLDLPEPSR